MVTRIIKQGVDKSTCSWALIKIMYWDIFGVIMIHCFFLEFSSLVITKIMSLKPRSKRRWRNTGQVPKFWSLQREAKLTRQKFQPRTAAPFSIPTWHFRIATPHGNGRLKDLVGAWENQLSPARNLSKLQSIHFFKFSAWVANNSLGKCHEEPGRRKTTVVTYLLLIFWIWQHTSGKTSCLACSRRDENVM